MHDKEPSFELARGVFNPAIIPLTSEWSRMLIAHHPRAVYLAAFRSAGAQTQCSLLAVDGYSETSHSAFSMNGCKGDAATHSCTKTAFVLLDKHFAFVTNVTTGPERPRRPGNHSRSPGMHSDTVPSRKRHFWMETHGLDLRLDVVVDDRALCQDVDTY
jgi:hypothetical protein